jgi:hypothetical protein
MRLIGLLPIMLIAACSSGPTKDDARAAFAATTLAMSSAQASAVSHTTAAAPGNLTLDYSGPCELGGTVAVTGTYDSAGSGSHTDFDLDAKFSGCHDELGTLDGALHWTSTVDATGFTAAMTGDIDFTGPNHSASCTFDLHASVTAASIGYSGTVCGYDVRADLSL